ncbi:MAG: hypothetical protein KGO48_07975 [Alphaproteobacteria bacterium]|nr:hypothetical protein [Alphaproteobacteria bacterium]
MRWFVAATLAALMLAQSAAVAQQDFSKVEIKTTDVGHGMNMLEGGIGNITVAASNVQETQKLSPQSVSVPNLMGEWVRSDTEARFMPPASGAGPVRDDPKHPHHGHREGVPGLPDLDATPWVGDLTNPILKPWVANALKKNGEMGLAGEEVSPPHVYCRPSGVPLSLALLENVHFMQTPAKVTLVYQRDHQLREIYLNVPHSQNPAPSYYGESVGHYEGGTLVVDTIAMNDRTVTDLYNTPHSDAIHVIERYRLVNDGKNLRVDFTVDDPKAFNMPWSAVVNYRRTPAAFQEVVCAENNIDVTTGKLYPIPAAARPDF